MITPSQFAKAIADISEGCQAWRLGLLLAWQDVKQRYRRSTLGPVWLTISMSIQIFVMGVLTATFGGVIRDVLAHEPSVLLQRELYVTPALAGAATFVLLQLVGTPTVPAGIAGFVVAIFIRAGAILWKWSLPGFGGPVDADG